MRIELAFDRRHHVAGRSAPPQTAWCVSSAPRGIREHVTDARRAQPPRVAVARSACATSRRPGIREAGDARCRCRRGLESTASRIELCERPSTIASCRWDATLALQHQRRSRALRKLGQRRQPLVQPPRRASDDVALIAQRSPFVAQLLDASTRLRPRSFEADDEPARRCAAGGQRRLQPRGRSRHSRAAEQFDRDRRRCRKSRAPRAVVRPSPGRQLRSRRTPTLGHAAAP